MVSQIVGREEELACLFAFVDDVREAPAALALEGEAGIGKSTLWLAGVERARTRGSRVLSSRPAEAERSLAYAGLGDLFEGVLDDVLPALPPPRRRALEVALLLEEAGEEAVDERALGTATRSALQLLAEKGPLVVAIDDLQWFDRSSAGALAFALRRLGATPVLLLLAWRLADRAQRSEVEQALPAENVQRLRVGPLSVGALHRFLRDRLERPLARQTLLRVHERSGGNPFFALELARVLDAGGDPAEPLPVPEPLDALVRARHLALSREAPDADVAADLDAAARVAAGRGASAVAAELAEQALRLTPPDAPEERRRRALAVARAQHAAGEWTRARAIATELLAKSDKGSLRAEALVFLAELENTDRAASLLEEALVEAASRPALRSEIHCRLAWATRFRKGYVRALEHARAAFELAEDLDDEVLRGRAQAVHAILGWFAGEALPGDLGALVEYLPSALGGERPVQEATQAIVFTLALSSKRDEARLLLEHEYREWSERDEPRSARALWGLSWVEFWAGRWALAAEHAARAHDVSIQYGIEVPQDHLPIALVAAHRGELELAREHSERALELAEEQFGLHPPQHLAILGLVALGSGDMYGAAARLGEADREARTFGWREPSIRWWSADYVDVLLELGRIGDAVRVLDAWEADAARLGRAWVLAHVTRCRALVAAAHGDVEQALGLLERAVAEHEAVDDPFGRARALLALGTVRRRNRQKRAARDAIEAAIEAFETIGAAGWAEKARTELARIGGRRSHGGELTPTERRLAELVAEGRSNKEIAAALFVTPKTVGTTLSPLYAKLGIHSRTELIRRVSERPASNV